MKKVWMFLLSIPFIVSCSVNKEKDGVRVGKWRYQTKKDRAEGALIEGRYDKMGNEKGIWLYYDGHKRVRKEVYHKDYCINYLFYENGNISEFGLSKQRTDDKMIVWDKKGKWFLFDEQGTLVKIISY